MNCYAGLAKRIVKSCFPQVVPVPQLEPLDASKIIKQEACIALSNVSQKKLVNQQTYWTHERLFNPKPITDEEVWAATLAWAEAKAKEREAEALKASSQTETDQSYDSDDSEFGVPINQHSCPYPESDDDEGDGDYGTDDDSEVGVPTHHASSYKKSSKVGLLIDEDNDKVRELVRCIVAGWVVRNIVAGWVATSKRYRAASIIQAAERGRAGRAYNAFASANKKPNKAVHFTSFNHPLRLAALPIDIYDQDAWYRAALRTQPAAPLHRLLRPRRLEQSSVRNWVTLHFINLFIIH